MDPDAAMKKVTLAWNPDDAAAVMLEMVTPGGREVRPLHLPNMCDKIGATYDSLTIGGRDAGNSAYTAYVPHERSILSVALANPDVQIGDEVVIGWGEAGGGYGNYRIPPDDIFDIRARVSPTPYTRVAREDYRK